MFKTALLGDISCNWNNGTNDNNGGDGASGDKRAFMTVITPITAILAIKIAHMATKGSITIVLMMSSPNLPVGVSG